MTAEQALHSYDYNKGYKKAEAKPHTLRNKIKKYFEDNAYYFFLESLSLSGRPVTSADIETLRSLKNAA